MSAHANLVAATAVFGVLVRVNTQGFAEHEREVAFAFAVVARLATSAFNHAITTMVLIGLHIDTGSPAIFTRRITTTFAITFHTHVVVSAGMIAGAAIVGIRIEKCADTIAHRFAIGTNTAPRLAMRTA